MIPTPTAAGLFLCRDLISDSTAGEITLARVFRALATPLHPDVTNPFWAFAEIYGPLGGGELEVFIYALSDDRPVYYLRHRVEFTDRLTPLFLQLNMRHCRFPKAGFYEMMICIDDDIVAQRRFAVAQGVRQ